MDKFSFFVLLFDGVPSVVSICNGVELDGLLVFLDSFRPCLLARAAASFGSSTVTNSEQHLSRNWRSICPRMVVAVSIRVSVESVCSRSFASACHSASRNSNVMISSLWGDGIRPSKHGIAHLRAFNEYMHHRNKRLLPVVSLRSSWQPVFSSQMHCWKTGGWCYGWKLEQAEIWWRWSVWGHMNWSAISMYLRFSSATSIPPGAAA